jgi:tetratricopeptide (TPR) repeat protein
MIRGCSLVLLVLAAVLLVSAEPTARDVEALLRQAQAALARGDFEAALAQYRQAEERCDDPGFVAYNKGLLFYRWALAGEEARRVTRLRDAEDHLRCCLDDDSRERRGRALFALGNALLQRSQGQD